MQWFRVIKKFNGGGTKTISKHYKISRAIMALEKLREQDPCTKYHISPTPYDMLKDVELPSFDEY